MNLILFGPPGVGKSTLIGVLKSQGMRAIDLEDVYPSSIRFQLPSMVDGVVFGGADLNPRRKYYNTIKVALFMDQATYDARRARRDEIRPNKANQPQQSMDLYHNASVFDYFIDASGTAMDTAREVIGVIKDATGKEELTDAKHKI